MQCALEERSALRHSRHLVVDDQGGWAINPFDGFHRVGAEVGLHAARGGSALGRIERR